MPELISIIIPCYGQAHFLPAAVESCLAQEAVSIEIIVVDDGSPDDVAAALAPFAQRITLIRQPNAGLACARNRGLSAATGELVVFLDSDDWLLPHALAALVSTLRGRTRAVSQCGYRLLHQDGSSPDVDIIPSFASWREALCRGNTGPVHSFLYRTNDVRRIGGFRDIAGGHEDYDLHCRLALDGWDAAIVPSIGCVYRLTPGSMSTRRVAMRRSRLLVWEGFATRMMMGPSSRRDAVGVLQGVVSIAEFGTRHEMRLVATARRRVQVEGLATGECEDVSRTLADLNWAPPGGGSIAKAGHRMVVKTCCEMLLAAVMRHPATPAQTRPFRLSGMLCLRRGYRSEGIGLMCHACRCIANPLKRTAMVLWILACSALPRVCGSWYFRAWSIIYGRRGKAAPGG